MSKFSSLPSHRKISLTAGTLYVITFISIPTLFIYKPVKSAGYILGSGPDTSAIIGGVSEIIVGLAGIATAVVLYPLLKKRFESGALGLVAARILESSTIFAGVAFLLTIVSLRRSGARADSLAVSHALATLYDRIFLLGQSFMPAICDVLLGVMLYKSRLVPRKLAMLGIIAGPILLISYFAVMFNLIGQHDGLAGLLAFPVAIFEFSLGVRLIVKGFNPKAVASLESK